MKESIITYLSAIDISEAVMNRIKVIHDEVIALFGDVDIDDVLVCDIVNNGVREFSSLWFFSPTKVYECKKFMNTDDYDVTFIKKSLVYFNAIKENYCLNDEPQKDSQVIINALTVNGKITLNFHFTGLNCKYAIDIAKKYLIPNVISE